MSTHHELSQNISVEARPSTEPIDSVTLGSSMGPYASWETCENDAMSAMNADNQDLFTQILLQSPSIYSLKLGTLFAAKLGWCDSLRELLDAIQSKPPASESDICDDHPLSDKYFGECPALGFFSNLRSDTNLEELALLIAAVEGSAQVVEVLVEFLGVNFSATFDVPFFFYVYWNKDVESRDECLKHILPKLKPSDGHLETAAENGDFPTIQYLVNKMKLHGNFLYVRAAEKAIKNGHDKVAKWIISQPDLIPWKTYTGSIVLTAIDAQNYDILGFISKCVPNLSRLGHISADALWKFLKDKDRELYKKFVPQYPDGYTLYME